MPAHAQFFAENGFVLIRGGIPPALIQDLRAAFEPIFALRDRGETTALTRHQTILEPRCYQPAFKEFLNLESINRAAEEVIGTRELVFAGLATLLGSPTPHLCNWHRDHPEQDPDTQAILRRPNVFLQLNCAVYDDPSLWVVPGTHNRASTAAELDYVQSTCPQGTQRSDGKLPSGMTAQQVLAGMPGAKHVRLNAGDCLLYNAIIWHAAEYNPAWKRATLHGGWRNAAAIHDLKPLRWGSTHNPWLLHPDYMGDLGPFFGPQLQRYQKMVRQYEPAFAAKVDADFATAGAPTTGAGLKLAAY